MRSSYQEIIEDLDAFGSASIFLLVVVFSFVLGEFNLFAQTLLGGIIAFVVIVPLRLCFFRVRPLERKFTNLLTKVDAGSFPSLHAMRAGVLATLLAVFAGNVFFTVFLLALVAAVCVSRVLQKRHFVSDVIVGVICGIIIAFFAIWLVGQVSNLWFLCIDNCQGIM